MTTIAEAIDECLDAAKDFSKTFWGRLAIGTETEYNNQLKDKGE
jgi:hypothetical protein